MQSFFEIWIFDDRIWCVIIIEFSKGYITNVANNLNASKLSVKDYLKFYFRKLYFNICYGKFQSYTLGERIGQWTSIYTSHRFSNQ